MPFDASKYEKYTHFQVSEVSPGVAHIAINRPAKRNCFSTETWAQYRDLLLSLNKERENVCVIILSGNGKMFSSGLDLKDAAAQHGKHNKPDPEEKEKALYEHIREFQEAISTPAHISIPVIAVAHKLVIGLGLDILSTTTIRYASKDTVFGLFEIKLGFAADIGSLQRLPRVINNQSFLNDIALTGRPFDARSAREVGLLSDVLDTKEEAFERALDTAKQIASHNKPGIFGTKDSLTFINEGGSVAEGLEAVARYNAVNLPQLSKL